MREASQRSRSVSARLVGARAGREVAAVVARGRHADQRVRHGLAVHEQDARIAGLGDLRQVALGDRVAAAALGERLEHDARVRIALGDDEDGAAAHAVERLEHRPAVLGEECLHRRHVARDQGGRAAVREPSRVGLFVHVPQALRPVHHQRARLLGALEQVGGIDVFHVEGRILAHQHRVDGCEVTDHGRAGAVPGPGIAGDLDGVSRAKARPSRDHRSPWPKRQRLESAARGGGQHGDRRVLGRLDGFERVHQHGEGRSGGHQAISGRLAGM